MATVVRHRRTFRVESTLWGKYWVLMHLLCVLFAAGGLTAQPAGGAPGSDFLAPTIDRGSILPPDGGNTAFEMQPLQARVVDAGRSGISVGSLSFTLTDHTANSSLVLDGTNVTYDRRSGWAKTTPVQMTPGHLYRIAVTASDLAGNTAVVEQTSVSRGGGFLATTIQPSPTLARIPSSPCEVELVAVGDFQIAACPNIQLEFDSTTVALGGNRLGNRIGYVDQTVSLDEAAIVGGTAGVVSTTPAYPPGQHRTEAMKFEVPSATMSTETLVVQRRAVELPALRVRIPRSWTHASIQMTDTPTNPSTPICAQPEANSEPIQCVPDPLMNRYVVLTAGSAEPLLSHGP